MTTHYNYELLPNNNVRQFEARLCCDHSWELVGPYTDEDEQELVEYSCGCGAGCVRDPLTNELVAYDNSQNVQINTNW